MISLLLQTFLLLFFPLSLLWVVNTTSDILARVAGIPVVGGVSAVAGMASLLFLAFQHRYCSYSMMTVAGAPSVVDSPSVPSARTVAGLPAFLSVLTSLQLLAFPAVAGVPAIASFPAVAVVSAVLVFFCCCWRSCRNFIMIFCPA
jgi:hypothetical protein